MNSDIEQYFYYKDRIGVIEGIIKQRYETLSFLSIQDEEDAKKKEEIGVEVEKECKSPREKKEKFQGFVDKLIVNIELSGLGYIDP